MKNLFGDNRLMTMMQIFRKSSSVTVVSLAQKLGVSERTIRNDIKQLNQELDGCAVIDGKQGRYTLRIFDVDAFQKAYARIGETEGEFTSSESRTNYIFGELMRADDPLLTDELAYEMNVGRTTMVSDLKKLRTRLKPFGLSIVGKTSKGLILQGDEIDIRDYVLAVCYDEIYKDYPQDPLVQNLIDQEMRAKSYSKTLRKQFDSYMTLMLDRFLTGHFIGKLSDTYYNLTAKAGFVSINSLCDRIADSLGIDIPVEEKIFTFLPIAGMRTPSDLTKMHEIELDGTIRPLTEKIMQEIQSELDIAIDPGQFSDEFEYHLMFMLNRLRFHVRQQNVMIDDLKQKYPLAYEMSGIAADVIEREKNLKVNEDERGHLASYFGLFLEENNIGQEKSFNVLVVCGSGRVTAKLIAVQLRRILDSSAQIGTISEEMVTDDLLKQYDLILTTVDLTAKTERPVIRIKEIFNEQELKQKIDKARYWDNIKMPVLDNNALVTPGLLDEDRVFFFDDGEGYEDALGEILDILTDEGELDASFADRLAEREEKGSMVFDRGVAIPHGIQYATEQMVMAVGILKKPAVYKGREVKVIFFLGLPAKSKTDDNLMIRVYDELIQIANDKEMLSQITAADSYQELLQAMYRTK